MEPKVVTRLEAGISLAVPSVQELAKDPSLSKVPPRYVRHDQDPVIHSLHQEVPVIDISKLLLDSGHQEEFVDSELEKLHFACKEWGFFQVINHGVSSSVVESVKKGVEGFFNMSAEEKNKFAQKPGDIEGLGQAFVMSEEQKLDWADMLYMITHPTFLRKPHLFPNLPTPFRDDLEAYSSELQSLAHKLLHLMAKALKMNRNDIKEVFDQGSQSMRINYYPPCPQPDLVIGLNAHSDAGGLTILLQINDKEGLQIRKDGMWVPVKPLPNAFIINIGDILEIVTNGIYRSIEHRATVNADKERLSIATFYAPKVDGELGPAPSLISKDRPALFKRISALDYFKGYTSKKLDGKSYIDTMRIPSSDEEAKI
ncbi:hypothetical protein FNV43_RR05923 [Rhamnella rubrinervis]|uniref:Fe2OG dioxygenase domain-containing protein n=1 Tax=Rhamnella rubrinervis TaxID=2594499 RepID=A0A8K0HCW2_9ROSA|nr:hypothetical protein FNV43_RR05923 [Rhamnella rubrinervis]